MNWIGFITLLGICLMMVGGIKLIVFGFRKLKENKNKMSEEEKQKQKELNKRALQGLLALMVVGLIGTCWWMAIPTTPEVDKVLNKVLEKELQPTNYKLVAEAWYPALEDIKKYMNRSLLTKQEQVYKESTHFFGIRVYDNGYICVHRFYAEEWSCRKTKIEMDQCYKNYYSNYFNKTEKDEAIISKHQPCFFLINFVIKETGLAFDQKRVEREVKEFQRQGLKRSRKTLKELEAKLKQEKDKEKRKELIAEIKYFKGDIRRVTKALRIK